MLEQIRKDRRYTAALTYAARSQTCRDHVDFGQQLPISQLAFGAVIDQRQMVRRALAGDPH